MPRLILHVGPAKCGSSSIQYFFAEHDKPCVENTNYMGLDYLDIWKWSHEEPSRSAQAKFTELLSSQLTGCDVLILSHEYLFQCPYAIKNICTWARNSVTDISIIGFSRRQSSFLASAYSQWSFRAPEVVQEVFAVLHQLDLDPALFSGLERQLIAHIICDFDNPLLSEHFNKNKFPGNIYDWYSSYKSIAQIVHDLGAITKCGTLPQKGSANTLLQDFCNKADLTLREGLEKEGMQIFNASLNETVVEAVNRAVVLGFGMPGPHEGIESLELISAKLGAVPNTSSEFLSNLKDYIDTFFFPSNYQLCQEYGLNANYFAPSGRSSKQEVLEAVINENKLRSLKKSTIIANDRVLSAQLLEKSLQALTEHLEQKKETERTLTALEAALEKSNLELSEIKASKVWKLSMFLRNVRLYLIPPDSVRAKIVRQFVNLILLPFVKKAKI